jgi:hypothetical protein
MDRLIQLYQGQGKLIVENNGETAVNYYFAEFQKFAPDGMGGQLPTTREIRGRVSHVDGCPDSYPITPLDPMHATLVMSDGRKLRAILITPRDTVPLRLGNTAWTRFVSATWETSDGL